MALWVSIGNLSATLSLKHCLEGCNLTHGAHGGHPMVLSFTLNESGDSGDGNFLVLQSRQQIEDLAVKTKEQ